MTVRFSSGRSFFTRHSKIRKTAAPAFPVQRFIFPLVDLAGIEPASESPSIEASPITVIIFTFPPSAA